MLETYFNITGIFEWLSFTASLIFLNKKTGLWQLFKIFLLIILIIESIGWYAHYILQKNNNWIFNILMLMTLPFFVLLFSSQPMAIKNKKSLLVIVSFFLFTIINFIWGEGFWDYIKYTSVFGHIILAAIACYFLMNIFKEEDSRDLFRYEYFWLANGLLLYCLGNIVLYLFLNALRAYYQETYINIYVKINGAINVLFYSSLIIAFICRHKATKL